MLWSGTDYMYFMVETTIGTNFNLFLDSLPRAGSSRFQFYLVPMHTLKKYVIVTESFSKS